MSNRMTHDEAIQILPLGIATLGHDYLTIYDLCLALISIMDIECCSYGFDSEADVANAYITLFEEEKGGK